MSLQKDNNYTYENYSNISQEDKDSIVYDQVQSWLPGHFLYLFSIFMLALTPLGCSESEQKPYRE